MTSNKHARAAQAAPETPRQKFQHRKIARRYAWQARDRAERQGRPNLFCYLRLCQLERLFADRYGAVLPDDDAGRDDLYVAATHIAQDQRSAAHIRDWAFLWAPWISDQEIAALVDRVLANPVRFRADTLGWRLGLTDAVRTRLEITTIAPIDCSKAARAQRTKERKAAKRKAASAARPAPAARTKPWEAAGICRRAWYYQKAKQKQQASECNTPDCTKSVPADSSIKVGANISAIDQPGDSAAVSAARCWPHAGQLSGAAGRPPMPPASYFMMQGRC